MSKRLSGIIGCKDKTSSWRLIGFPHGINSNIGSTVSCRRETHRYTVHLHSSPCRDTKQNKTKTKDTMSLYYSSVCNIGSWVVWVSMNEIYYLIIVMDVQRYTLLTQVPVAVIVSKLSNIEL